MKTVEIETYAGKVVFTFENEDVAIYIRNMIYEAGRAAQDHVDAGNAEEYFEIWRTLLEYKERKHE